MKKTILGIILLICFSVSCEKNSPAASVEILTDKPSQTEVEVPSVKLSINQINNLNFEEAIDKFQPIKDETFFVNDGLCEFRVGIYNVLSPDELSKEIEIRELTWEKDINNNYITVWYRKIDDQWKPILSEEWNKDDYDC